MSFLARPTNCPAFSDDLWADDQLADPFEVYRRLRELGPAVWLETPGVVAFPRFAEVRAALPDWQTYSSAEGVSLADRTNSSLGETILNTDPPRHDVHRKPLMDQLSVGALASDVEAIEATASRFVDRILAVGRFDAVAELARPYSLTVVGDLVGLPAEGRDLFPGLAERAFNVMGPANDRLADGFEALAELFERTDAACPHLSADGKGRELVERGLIGSVGAYTWPGIDTTVNALGAALWLFASHPDQWRLVRSDPSLIPSAFNEILRLHSPVQYFTRLTTGAVDVGGVHLAAATRVLIMYGSANRDERRFEAPERFDVTRNPKDQLAFGRGIHLCVGINLARIEAHSLLACLAERVERFELIGEPRWMVNNTLHGLETLAVRAVPS